MNADLNTPIVDLYDEFITINVIRLKPNEDFDVINYWNERYHSQPNLTRMALNILAVPPMSDECERLFSSAKLLLTDRRSRLKMDVIEACECLRAWFGRPSKPKYDNSVIGELEGELLCTGIRRNEGGDEGVSGGEDIQPVDQGGDRGDEEVAAVSDDDISLV